MRRLTRGRLSVYLEPRDIWIGLYLSDTAFYICPLPLLVFRWRRHEPVMHWGNGIAGLGMAQHWGRKRDCSAPECGS